MGAPRSRWWRAAPLAGVAVAALAIWALWPGDVALAIEVALEGGPRVRAGGRDGHVGQIARVRVTGGGDHRALRIYLHGQLMAACPGAASCSGPDRADLALTAAGRYVVLALAADAPLPALTGTLDADVSAAQAAGARWTWSALVVR